MRSLLLSLLLLPSFAFATYDPLPAGTTNAPDFNFRMIDENLTTIISSITSLESGNRTWSGESTFSGTFVLGVGGTPLAIVSTFTYAPATTNIANMTSVGAVSCEGFRVGNMVQMGCTIPDVDPSATAFEFELALPPGSTSDFSVTTDAHGSCSHNGTNYEFPMGRIRADATTNRLEFLGVCANCGASTQGCSISYVVK